jgi:hypothetical protein
LPRCCNPCTRRRHGARSKDKGGVWFACLDEIAAHVRNEIAAGWQPRVDRLPFWDAPLPGVIAGNGVLAS